MNIGIASSELLIRKALCALLQALPGVHVVWDIDSVLESSRLVRQRCPDVMLFHIANPARELNIISRIKGVLPEIKLVLLIDDVNGDLELFAIKTGVLGCVPKNSEPQLLYEALTVVARGQPWMSHRAAVHIIGGYARGGASNRGEIAGLTQREREILVLTVRGLSNKEMAGRLCISENTIKTHLITIYRKLGVTGRMGAAMYFQGAVSWEPEEGRVGSLPQTG
jgi:DNA-binding NarL/FixJ family response regulator